MQTCLIVDESPVVRKVAVRILFRSELSIEGVSTPDEARAWIAGNGLPDIILVSVHSAHTEALDFVREIAAKKSLPTPIILAIIVEANLGLMTRLKRAGAHDFILKPFDRKTLESGIGPYLQPAEAA